MKKGRSHHTDGGVPLRPDKRLLDLTVILLALPIALPFLGMIALITWAIQGSPVLFRQQRPGLPPTPRHRRSPMETG